MADRYSKNEVARIVGRLPEGKQVFISIWRLSDYTQIVNTSPCVEIIPAVYVYPFTQTSVDMVEYIWKMWNLGTPARDVTGQLIFGGFVDARVQASDLELLAKEASLIPLAKEASLTLLAQEASLTPLAKDSTVAKETTLTTKASQASVDSHRGAVESNIDVKISTRATPKDVKDFTITRIQTTPRALELIAKSVGNYYRGQVGTLVVMSTYAGAPTDVQMFATIYYPNDEVWKNEEAMTPLGETGLYTYGFAIPNDAPEGVYKVKYKAIKSIANQEIPDTFTEPNGLPSNWRIFGGTWAVVSYILKQTDSVAALVHWKDLLAVDWSNYTLEVDIRTDTNITNFTPGVIARYKSPTIKYIFYYSKYRSVLCLDKGITTILEKAKTLNWNQWYRFKIVVGGASIKCYLDGNLEFDYVDLNPILTGVPTFSCYSPTSFDNVLITIPAQEYQEFEVTDFMVGIAPAQEPSVQTIIDKTEHLPTDPTSKSELEAAHGAGSWEGAIEFKEK